MVIVRTTWISPSVNDASLIGVSDVALPKPVFSERSSKPHVMLNGVRVSRYIQRLL